MSQIYNPQNDGSSFSCHGSGGMHPTILMSYKPMLLQSRVVGVCSVNNVPHTLVGLFYKLYFLNVLFSFRQLSTHSVSTRS
jgi:hypothetical protein